jgi:hypothetical protein
MTTAGIAAGINAAGIEAVVTPTSAAIAKVGMTAAAAGAGAAAVGMVTDITNRQGERIAPLFLAGL